MGFYSYHDNAQAQSGVQMDLNAVMRQVYAWMTLGLLATAGTAFFMASSGAAISLFRNPLLMILTMIGYLVLVFALQPIIMRAQVVIGILAYFAITVVLGVMTSSIFLYYRIDTIGFAFLAAAGTFGAMSIIGYTTNTDLTRFGGILRMAVIGLIVATLINFLFASEALYWVINYAGVAIFAGLAAYNTQQIRNVASTVSRTNDLNAITRVALIGAFMLYINFVNLFLFLLQILGGGGRRR